ncbi:hypothetical protein L6164_000787 [Bauhinia variegata]|uniref:Uncharacterized protein n=1 Tax=Bauhinia variegata TaxID=167791 RepID=A0ACB9Q7J7_BAUVA|nr:hypothetical protein L6164_000787 [Bauhinia variegata]
MAAELVTALLTQLATLIGQEAAQEVKLVVGAEEQVEKITSNLQAIQDVLEDAEKKQVKQADVRDWLYKLKQASYDIDDVLDERNTAILKLKIEKEAILAQVSSVLAKKVCSFISSPCFYFSWTVHRHDIAFKIGDLNEKLEMISKEKEKYRLNSTRGSEETERLITTSFVDVSETLKVEQCDQIKLPQGIGMLVNLRHLHRRYSYIPDMPKGIGKLTTLRTLDEFKVTKGDYTNGCKLGDLKDLNHLRGELSITGLECVSNLYEAEVACLKHKKHLRSLTLHFDVLDDDGGRTFQKHLLNALEPHQDLEHLRIFSYSGTGLFPNWILSLTKLKLLSLNDCVSLEQFPPVGKLPNLESLEISYAWSIKKVGIEFLGLEESEGGQKQKNECENSKSSLVLFPKLKSLSFSEIKNWEEWKGLPTKGEIAVMPSLRSLTISSCDELWKGLPTEGEIAVMPSLRSLTISSCDELKALPEFLHVAPLQELSINHCSNLRQRYQVGTGEDWPKISHIPYVSII